MTSCCKICCSIIENEHTVIMDNSNTIFHRHCYNLTIDNYNKIVKIDTLRNIKEKYPALKNKNTQPIVKSRAIDKRTKSVLQFS